MAAYEIFFKESVWKELDKIPKSDLNKILSRLSSLETIRDLRAVKNSQAMFCTAYGKETTEPSIQYRTAI